MRQAAMTIPPISLFLAVPIAGATVAFTMSSRLLAQASGIDEHTAVSLFPAIFAGAVLFVTVWRASAAWTRSQGQLKAQAKLLKILCKRSPQVDENESHVKELLSELDTDEA